MNDAIGGINRRTLLAAAALLAPAAHAKAGYPARPITVICPFSPGGTADVQLRVLTAAASREIGQPMVVETRAGAAGTLGPSTLLNSAADGYTLSFATAIALLRQPFIQPTRYDPAKDFTYIIGVTRFECGLVVRADAPWKTLDEFLRDAKRKPGGMSYGTAGQATAQHTAMLKLADKLGIEWTNVPYKGSADVFNALSAGQVDAISETSGWAPFVDSGKFRILAMYSDKRLKRWPDAPTLKESGYDIVESIPWGIVGPARLDPAVVKTLFDVFSKAMQDPAFISNLATVGQEAWGADSRTFTDYMLSRIPLEREAVTRYRLKQQ
ncbi:tripartite tricarboxylate transporter substrate binding protein [Variovorax sp. J22R133]|uniref:tripartite tricarboxylate transporter substrate binding protein n=1 Tax=Variovorax brevis TaxID=3053503 RepID=UPI0025785B21|nr:tripartite tricarboxylate transporter substrate binding protein [Variovorax sp. J22R133]MDM0111406.1 tripartite tricarboxylate transporter substrate binding protein [Variovorax sp. J22R133]